MKILLTLIALALPLQAKIVKLKWDANPAVEKVASYRVTYGLTPAMGQSLTVATNSASTPDLAPGTYYFAVQAVNVENLASGFSPQISHLVTPPPLPQPTVPMNFMVVIEATVTVTPIPAPAPKP